jgi:4-hydroxybenzoate polyprenyltransferase
MGSLWTIILTWSFNIPLMLAVCGLNAIINYFVDDEEKPCTTGLYKAFPPESSFLDQNSVD